MTVDGILKENVVRLKRFGGRDQYSGKGIEYHTEKVVIDGYPIRTQWLTKEVAQNPLFKIAAECGSIAKMFFVRNVSCVDFETVSENERYYVSVNGKNIGDYEKKDLFLTKEDLLKSL